MVKGAVRIETRVTQGFENGIYRITEEKQRFLLLAFDKVDEARTIGKAIANLLEVPFRDHIYTDPKLDGAVTGRMSATQSNLSNEPKTLLFTRPKRVMGAEKDCIKLLQAGKSEEVVKQHFIEKYTEAGHRGNKPEKLASWLIHAAKKKVVAAEGE